MNLIGMAIIAKAAKEASRSSGGGHYEPPKKEKSYEEKVYDKVTKYLSKNGVVSSPTDVDLTKKKFLSKEKPEQITILAANPKGIKDFQGLEDGKYVAVGMANGRFFAIEKDSMEISFTELSVIQYYGPHGDYTNIMNPFLEDPEKKSYEFLKKDLYGSARFMEIPNTGEYDGIKRETYTYKKDENGFKKISSKTEDSRDIHNDDEKAKKFETEILGFGKTVREKLKSKELEEEQGMGM